MKNDNANHIRSLTRYQRRTGHSDELHLAEPLAIGAVKENSVIFVLPDCIQPNASRAMQAEVHSASLTRTRENSFRHGKDAWF